MMKGVDFDFGFWGIFLGGCLVGMDILQDWYW